MGAFAGMAIGIVTFMAWLTHVVHCFTDELWGLLIAGAIFFPIGIINGVGLWFDWW
jgi:hypothetical protein